MAALPALSHQTCAPTARLTVLASLYLAEMSLGTPRYAELPCFAHRGYQMFAHWSLVRCLYGRRAVNLRYTTHNAASSTSYAIGLLVMYAQQEDYFEFLLYKGLRARNQCSIVCVHIVHVPRQGRLFWARCGRNHGLACRQRWAVFSRRLLVFMLDVAWRRCW